VVFLAEPADRQYEQRVAIEFMRGELALFGAERRFRAGRSIDGARRLREALDKPTPASGGRDPAGLLRRLDARRDGREARSAAGYRQDVGPRGVRNVVGGIAIL
jgi:hypothetical protein